MKVLKVLACILFLHSFTVLKSQETEAVDSAFVDLLNMSMEELINLEVFTASRSKMSIKDLPVSVHIISRDEILKNNYTNLVDALKDIPGVKVSQPGSGTHGDTFLMRGFFGNYYTKILIDGMPVQPSVVDGMPLGEQINMKNVARIEVIYGPASALYGADALAGVINIITYNPDENYTRAEGTFAKNYYHGNVFSNWKINENIRFNIHGIFSKRSDMNLFDANPDILSDTDLFGDTVIIDDLRSENRNFGAGFTYKNLKIYYDYMYRNSNSSLGQTEAYYIYNQPEIIWGETINRLAIHHDFKRNNWRFSTNASYLNYRMDTESAFAMIFYSKPLYKYMASDDILIEEVANFAMSDNVEFVGGISFQYSGAMPKTNDLDIPFDDDFYTPFSTEKPDWGVYQDSLFKDFGFNPLTYSNIGSFLQTTYNTEKLTLIGGVRFDSHSEYGKTFNPRFAAQFKATSNISFRASYSEAFKAPTPYTTYNSLAVRTEDEEGNIGVDYWGIPNKNLEPEEFSAMELGGRFAITNKTHIEIIGFYNQIKGLITNTGHFKIDPAQFPYNTKEFAGGFVNNENAEGKIGGVDLIFSARNLIERINLNTNISFRYAKGNEDLPNGEHIDAYRMMPEKMAKIRCNAMPLNNLFVGLDFMYSDDWYARNISSKVDLEAGKISGYSIVDVVINYKIPFDKIQCLCFNLKINNLFDTGYAGIGAYGGPNDLQFNPQLGRIMYGGVNIAF